MGTHIASPFAVKSGGAEMQLNILGIVCTVADAE
jgi:hypothetical protein